MSIDTTVSAKQLAYIRQSTLIFRDIDFSLNAGELLHITGPNGCGKTSLLRLLAGFSDPAKGEICWNGKNIQDQRQDYINQIHYLTHQTGIKGDLTVLENLLLFLPNHLNAKEKESYVRKAVVKWGLVKCINDFASHLSAGQKQRVALARMQLSNSQLYLLDEPFTTLDNKYITVLTRLIDKHLSNKGIVVIASHQSFPSAANAKILKLGEAEHA